MSQMLPTRKANTAFTDSVHALHDRPYTLFFDSNRASHPEIIGVFYVSIPLKQ